MTEYIYSVALDEYKCRGCTHCIKRCPTEAIRVKNKKSKIISKRCIDCGECIRVCPYRAKRAVYDVLDDEMLKKFKYKIALPEPALYGQFDNLNDVDYVLEGLLRCGFDDIFEVSVAAEILSDYARNNLCKLGLTAPIISSACPAVTRLISVRYPNLVNNILPLLPPVEIAAKLARFEALKKNPDLKSEDVGIFYISPCPAKVSYVKNPGCVKKSDVDVTLAISSIYFRLVPEMKEIKMPKPVSRSGVVGISWASTGGESSALFNEKYLSADGIENVINMLDKIENENFAGTEFIELNACNGGCVGGTLTLENAFVAKERIQRLKKYLPFSQNTSDKEKEKNLKEYRWETNIEYNPVMKLHSDKSEAVKMMIEMEKIYEELPALDCGACGAPSCRAFAEDIVRGFAAEGGCPIKSKDKSSGNH